jgi:hypothetical protein
VQQIVATDQVVYLLGRPPIQDFLGFVSQQAPGLHNQRALMDEWRLANDHIRDLEEQEVGWADGHPPSALGDDLLPFAAEVEGNLNVQQSFALPTSIGIVELDRVVVFQKFINLRYVAELQEQLGTNPSPEALFRFSLPADPAMPPMQWRNVGNGFVFTSPSGDFRALDMTVLNPAQVLNYVPGGFPSAIVALVLGHGINFLQVISAEGRLILGNGSHRAFALRDMGITHVPALIQSVSRRDELPLVGSAELVQQPDQFLTAPRPPVLKDYFDEDLRKVLDIPRSGTQVRVAVAVEVTRAPL